MAPCALWAWACLWAVGRGRGGAGCHCHGHCQQPRATASTMATPSRQGATWGWWSGGTEPEIGGAGPAGARGRQMPAGAAASQQQQTAGGCGGEARPLLNKRLLLGVSGEPKVALRSKGLVPEGRGAVKFLRRAAAAGPAADQHQQRARGCGSAVLPPLTGRLRPKPKCIASMAPRSKEPAPERRGVVKFLHVGLLLL